jgi:hypothetical protein
LRLGKTVKQMLAELDSYELTEWQAFFKLEDSEHAAAARGVRPQRGPVDVKTTLRALFGDRVVKKNKNKTD